MNVKYFKTVTSEYSLFIQVTEHTSNYSILTIIYHNNSWKEDIYQLNENEYRNINFENIYTTITETEFANAQNNILATIGKTRVQLNEEYHRLWFDFYATKLQIVELLIKSNINLNNYWEILAFREEQENILNTNGLRQAIQNAYQNNNPNILSNEDIFNKVASDKADNYLTRRRKIQSEIKK